METNLKSELTTVKTDLAAVRTEKRPRGRQDRCGGPQERGPSDLGRPLPGGSDAHRRGHPSLRRLNGKPAPTGSSGLSGTADLQPAPPAAGGQKAKRQSLCRRSLRNCASPHYARAPVTSGGGFGHSSDDHGAAAEIKAKGPGPGAPPLAPLPALGPIGRPPVPLGTSVPLLAELSAAFRRSVYRPRPDVPPRGQRPAVSHRPLEGRNRLQRGVADGRSSPSGTPAASSPV